MSHLSTGALGLVAASLAFGGVQFGMASDDGLVRGDASLRSAVTRDIAATVNRAIKTDRGALVPAAADRTTTTLSFQLRGLDDTSIAMRLPTAEAARLRAAVSGGIAVNRAAVKASDSRPKAMIACEPVVSPLTDVAKQLAPGRCLT